MNPEWQFVLNETAVGFLIACKVRQRDVLLKALQQIAANPYQRGDYEARDSAGRSVHIKQVEGFLITFWADSYANELRVICIERTQPR